MKRFLAIIFIGLMLIAAGCRPSVVYIPGDDESSKVVYFVKKDDPCPINGIVLSKAKFMRLCKRAKTEVKDSDVLWIVTPDGEGDND